MPSETPLMQLVAALAMAIPTLKAVIHTCFSVPVVIGTFIPRRNTTMPAVATEQNVRPTTPLNAELLRFLDLTANHYAENARRGLPFCEIEAERIPSFIDRPGDVDLVFYAAELGHSEGSQLRHDALATIDKAVAERVARLRIIAEGRA